MIYRRKKHRHKFVLFSALLFWTIHEFVFGDTRTRNLASKNSSWFVFSRIQVLFVVLTPYFLCCMEDFNCLRQSFRCSKAVFTYEIFFVKISMLQAEILGHFCLFCQNPLEYRAFRNFSLHALMQHTKFSSGID